MEFNTVGEFFQIINSYPYLCKSCGVCVVLCEMVEHIENDRASLKKTNDLLTEGGQLILSVPARQKYWSKDDKIIGHYRRYEKQ